MRLKSWILYVAMSLAGPRLAPAQPASGEVGPIQDNGFLIEEAYNQEKGVVQHISSLNYVPHGKNWAYTFTQEWPLPWNWRHQLSYSVSAVKPDKLTNADAGIGDSAINYRYQLVGSGESPVAIAPRFTLLLPTGDSQNSRGFGATAYQINLPASMELGSRLVTHLNAGGTFVPNAKNTAGDEARSTGYNLGASVIALAHPRFNVMLETLWTGQGSVVDGDRVEFGHSLFISPGMRWAHNLQSGLQIVPGMAVAQGIGPSSDERVLIFYLSLEHPFSR
jgi:hypothetical protein